MEKPTNVLSRIGENNTISTQVFTKLTKFPVHWSSKIPTNYKVNAISCELHTAIVFNRELRKIKTDFLQAGYPVKFFMNTFFRFNEEKEELIPKWFFDVTKSVVIRLPFAPINEKFINRLKSTQKLL